MNNTRSKAYAQKNLTPKLKEDVTILAGKVRQRRIERVRALTWMKEETKKAAIDKLESIPFYVAYPDTYEPDFSFHLTPRSQGGTLLDFLIQARAQEARKQLDMIHRPANTPTWEPSYLTSAYYTVNSNCIFIFGGGFCKILFITQTPVKPSGNQTVPV